MDGYGPGPRSGYMGPPPPRAMGMMPMMPPQPEPPVVREGCACLCCCVHEQKDVPTALSHVAQKLAYIRVLLKTKAHESMQKPEHQPSDSFTVHAYILCLYQACANSSVCVITHVHMRTAATLQNKSVSVTNLLHIQHATKDSCVNRTYCCARKAAYAQPQRHLHWHTQTGIHRVFNPACHALTSLLDAGGQRKDVPIVAQSLHKAWRASQTRGVCSEFDVCSLLIHVCTPHAPFNAQRHMHRTLGHGQ